MLIPVCSIASFGSIRGSMIYDTDTCTFKDTNTISNRVLPIQDYMNCTINNIGEVCTIVGRGLDSSYYVCFGDMFIYRLERDDLIRYKISNAMYKSGRLMVTDKPQKGVLDSKFPDKGIRFRDLFSGVQSSSLGTARKFYSTYRGRDCIVKFSKMPGRYTDLDNEVLYKKVCDSLNVPCCDVKKTVYYGYPCILSFFEYKRGIDCFQSFKKLGKPIQSIYEGLSKRDKISFDKMLLIDFFLRQQDRHMSNIALVNNRLYPLFDNGECLGIGARGTFSLNFEKLILSNKNHYRKVFSRSELVKLLKISLVQERVKMLYDD